MGNCIVEYNCGHKVGFSLLGDNRYTAYVTMIQHGSYSDHIAPCICKALSLLFLCSIVGANGLRCTIFENLVLGCLFSFKTKMRMSEEIITTPNRWHGDNASHCCNQNHMSSKMQRSSPMKGWCQPSLATWMECSANQASIFFCIPSHIDRCCLCKTKNCTKCA